MKSPEQMGGLPEQPKEEPMEEKERKVTTPEEAEEMTRQRKKDFGLEEQERKELLPEAIEAVDQQIEKFLEVLDSYDYESFSPEIQEQWYWAEQEAMVGKDRLRAAKQLEVFLETLRKETEKSGK